MNEKRKKEGILRRNIRQLVQAIKLARTLKIKCLKGYVWEREREMKGDERRVQGKVHGMY